MEEENNKNKIYDLIEVDDNYFLDHEEEQETLFSRIKDLPLGVVNILFGEDTAEIMRGVCHANNLSVQQSTELSRLIRNVLIADIYIGDMPAQISSKLGVDQNTALEIARAIVSQLFAPVIEDIKELQLQKFGKLPGPNMPQQAPQARKNFAPQNLGGQARQLEHIPGEELPETGGNIIDLRNQK